MGVVHRLNAIACAVESVCDLTCLVCVDKLLRLCKRLWHSHGPPWQGVFLHPQLQAQPQGLEGHLSNYPAAGFRQDLHRQAGLMLPQGSGAEAHHQRAVGTSRHDPCQQKISEHWFASQKVTLIPTRA